VIASIAPWNYPLQMAAWKILPAIAAGSSIVLKPAELTPTTSVAFAEAAQRAGIPDGVINVIAGRGSIVGEALVTHPDVGMISFTGSTRAGSRVGSLAAGVVKRVHLELGTGLRAQPIPTAVVRGAHFMSNWDAALAHARDQGELHTFVPIDIALPMVAPRRSRPRRGPPAHRRLGTRLDSSTSATSRGDPTVTRPATSRPPSRRHWPAPSKRVGSRALSGSGRSASSGSRRRRHGRTRA